MTIITDNYIWFLISGCILLLITIGYFAEQTNFGKKKIGENVKDLDDNNFDYLQQNVNNTGISDIYGQNNTQDNIINRPVDEITQIPDMEISFIPDNSITNNFGKQNDITNVDSTFMNTGTSDGTVNNLNYNTYNAQNGDLTDDDIWKF